MQKVNRIDDKARFENAYHAIMKCAETFFLFAPNIPRNLHEVVEHIHGRYDNALYNVFRASNTFDADEKVRALNKAHESLFFQQSSLEYLIRSHGVTVGQANLVIDDTREAYRQVQRWKNSILKTQVDKVKP